MSPLQKQSGGSCSNSMMARAGERSLLPLQNTTSLNVAYIAKLFYLSFFLFFFTFGINRKICPCFVCIKRIRKNLIADIFSKVNALQTEICYVSSNCNVILDTDIVYWKGNRCVCKECKLKEPFQKSLEISKKKIFELLCKLIHHIKEFILSSNVNFTAYAIPDSIVACALQLNRVPGVKLSSEAAFLEFVGQP